MSVLRRRHFKPKSLKRQDNFFFFLMSEVTDIQTGHWANSIHAFLVSSVSVTPETLTYDVPQCTINQVPVTLSIYVLYLCIQEMSSFHFQIITLKNSHLNFYPLCHSFDQFSREWPIYIYSLSLCLCLSLCKICLLIYLFQGRPWNSPMMGKNFE